MNGMKIHYQEVSLQTVIGYFAKGFEGVEPHFSEWFIDTQKGVVIFKLYTKESQEQKGSGHKE